MELVKLKMKKSYKIVLIIISILLIFIISIGIIYYKYNDTNKIINSNIEVNGNLSINYIDGRNINITNNQSIKLSITNNSSDDICFNINFNKVRGNNKYRVTLGNLVVSEGKLSTKDNISSSNIIIKGNTTNDYVISVIMEDNICKGIINISEVNLNNVSFKDILLNKVNASTSSLTKPGIEKATLDEGLIKSNDDIGESYYYRGNVTNNYVSFGGMLWRIVRINGDGTIRIILDGTTDSVSSYYKDELIEKYKESNLKDYLDNWLNINLSNYIRYLANSKYCNDTLHDEGYNYETYTRIITNKIPTLNCLGESVVANIGVLSIDEVILAGALYNEVNNEYYLYNSNIEGNWYTMSGAKGSEDSLNLFMVKSTGEIDIYTNGNLNRYVRPVINLVKNIKMTGNGTKDDPYKLAN